MVDPSKRRAGKNAHAVDYQDIPSSIAPVPHCPELPIPVPPNTENSSSEESSCTSDGMDNLSDAAFEHETDERVHYFPTEENLADLIRELGLAKISAELLTSRLKHSNLLDNSVRVTNQRTRHQTFSTFFNLSDGLCICHDVTGLFSAIGITFNPNEWRLFIDSSNRSLKAVLRHNGNQLPSLHFAHPVHLK
jgi:hypothetical protein